MLLRFSFEIVLNCVNTIPYNERLIKNLELSCVFSLITTETLSSPASASPCFLGSHWALYMFTESCAISLNEYYFCYTLLCKYLLYMDSERCPRDLTESYIVLRDFVQLQSIYPRSKRPHCASCGHHLNPRQISSLFSKHINIREISIEIVTSWCSLQVPKRSM